MVVYVSAFFDEVVGRRQPNTGAPTMPLTSLRAYAKHRGVSLAAVQTAIDAGRLRESVTRDEHGTRKIANVELADCEWRANTMPRVGQPDTREPVDRRVPLDREAWPAWAPGWVRELNSTPADVLGCQMRDHALAIALARLHLEAAPDPAASVGALLDRLRPLLADAPPVPNFAPMDVYAALTLDEALDELLGPDENEP